MRRVFLNGIGETKLGKLPNRSVHDLVREAGQAAISDAGIEPAEVEAIFVGNFAGGQLFQQGHLGPLVSETLGISSVPTIRTEGACASGGLAFHQAVMSVKAGLYDTVLVGGVERMTHQTTPVVTKALASAMDIEREASTGLTFPGSFALIANRYFYEYGNVLEEMAMVSVNSHRNALLNPHAQLQKQIDIDTVLNAPRIADPLGLYDCLLITDGAAFVVISSRPTGADRKIMVSGIGHGGDALTLQGKSSITEFAATKRASARAYEQAGMSPQDIDLAEVHDCFSITQIINIEDLGFVEKGKGASAVRDGEIALEGRIPINTSGGLKAKGHPIGATGICQIVEVATQLRGNAGPRQIAEANVGITHNLGGTAATCVVTILEGE